MARIWGNESGGKTATGMKWEGNVIAVPGKYKLGETYQLTFTANGQSRTIDAVAVDRSKSFAAPKDSDLFRQVQGKDVEVKVKHIEVRRALAVTDDRPVRRAIAVNPTPASVAPSYSSQDGSEPLIKPTRSLSLTEETNLVGALNNGGVGKFSSARDVQNSPDQARKMADALIKQYSRPENKLEQLAAVFRNQPSALYDINQRYNFHLLTTDVANLPGYHSQHPGRERIVHTREQFRPFASNATLRDLPPSPAVTPPPLAVGNTTPNPAQFDSRSMGALFGRNK